MADQNTLASNAIISKETLVGLAIQFVFTAAVAIVCIALFELIRRRNTWIYAPKYFIDRVKSVQPSPAPGESNQKLKQQEDPEQSAIGTLQNPGKATFSWVTPTLGSSDAMLMMYAGLDATMFTKFLAMSARLFGAATILVIVILLPVNISMGSIMNTGRGWSSLSIASIPSGDPMFWVPALASSLIAGAICYLTFNLWCEYIKLRVIHFKKEDNKNRIYCRTLVLTDLQPKFRDETAIRDALDKMVKTVLKQEISGKTRKLVYGTLDKQASIVEQIYIDRDARMLHDILESRDKYLQRLERLLVGFVRRFDKGCKEQKDLGLDSPRTLRAHWQAWRRERKREKKMEKIQDIVSVKNDIIGQSLSIKDLVKLHGYLDPALLPKISLSPCGTKLDGYDYFCSSIKDADTMIEKYRKQHLAYFKKQSQWVWWAKKVTFAKSALNEASVAHFEANFPPQSTAFVTFRTRNAALIFSADSALPDPKALVCSVRHAPEPRDILWDNVSASLHQRAIRLIISGFSVGFLVIFYLIPVMGIVGLTDLRNLAKFIPALEMYKDNVWMRAVTENFIPTVLITVFMFLLQNILVALSKAEQPFSNSELHHAVMDKYFYFELFNVFVAFSLGTSVFDLVANLFSNPKSVLIKIASSLPQNAPFFVNYIMLGVSLFAIEVLQIKRVVKNYFVYWFVSDRTPRVKFNLKNHRSSIDYGQWYPTVLLVFITATTYATIFPIIVPFAALYFAFGYLIFRYLTLYVYAPKYETGGSFFSEFVFGKIILALIIQLSMMMGYLILHEAYLPAALVMAPSLLAVIAFRWYVFRTFGEAANRWGPETVSALRRNVEAMELDGWKEEDGNFADDESEEDDDAFKSRSTLVARSDMDLVRVAEEEAKDGGASKMKSGSEDELAVMFGDEYDPKTFVHPAFHQPIQQIWLPNRTKECLMMLSGQYNDKLNK